MTYITFVQNGRAKLNFIIAKVSILEAPEKNDTKIDELIPRLIPLLELKAPYLFHVLLVKVVKTTLSIYKILL